jgi:pentose-5-phosphate-3-epimerase
VYLVHILKLLGVFLVLMHLMVKPPNAQWRHFAKAKLVWLHAIYCLHGMSTAESSSTPHTVDL